MNGSTSTPHTIVHGAFPAPRAFREQLYRGAIFLAPPSPARLALADAANALLRDALGDDPRGAHGRIGDEETFRIVGAVRKEMYTAPRFHELLRAVLRDAGFEPSAVAFDPPRLRIVHSGGHHEPRARGVYRPHRDTWYAHPAALLVGWIPLDDLGAHETFEFYPERFDAPVPNDSELFDYDSWSAPGLERRLGWQKRETGLTAHYPGFVGEPDLSITGTPLGFSCARGSMLCFSGAHFHATRPQDTGRTRFSVDFRVVPLDDVAAGRGAPLVDSRCTGSALRDYVHPRI